MSNFDKVKQFHETFGQPVGDKPEWIPGDREALRLLLIEEEVTEVNEAVENFDLPNLAKELADLLYVTYGFAVELGIDLDDVFEKVHENNMSKVWDDGKVHYREDGKVIKPPNFVKLDESTLV